MLARNSKAIAGGRSNECDFFDMLTTSGERLNLCIVGVVLGKVPAFQRIGVEYFANGCESTKHRGEGFRAVHWQHILC